jgi:hypothetical protein
VPDSVEDEIALLERKRAALLGNATILPGQGTLERAVKGYYGNLENAASMLTGIPATIAGETLAAATAATQGSPVRPNVFRPNPPAQMTPDQVAQQVTGALTYQPRTMAGQTQQQDLQAMFRPVGQMVESVSRLGENPSEFGEHTIKGLIAAAPIKLGRAAKAAPRVSTSPAINTARELGYSVEPRQIVHGEPLGTVTQRAAATFGGKAAIPAQGSLRNQRITQSLVAEELGVPAGENITPDTIKRLYAETSKPYEALQNLKNSNGVPYRINLARDSQYLQSLRQSMGKATSGVTGAIDPASRALYERYLRPKQGTTVSDTMADIQRLRDDAGRNFKSDNAGTVNLGRAQRQVALALEGALERQVGARNSQAVQAWQSARQRRAKVHAVEDAMVGTEIDGRLLARAREHGEMLTGRLAQIADVAEAMPQMMQANARLGTTQSLGLLDAAMTPATGLAGYQAGGIPGSIAAALAWPTARWAGRQIALNSAPATAMRGITATGGATALAGGSQAPRPAEGESFGDFIRRRQREMGTRQ